MPAKAPIYLKPNSGKNGSGAGKNGQKLRELLSTEMISLPLDFRHKAHVGRGGADDMFGDTTFLNQKNAKETATTNGATDKREGIMTFQSMRRKGKSSKKDKSSGTKADAKSLSNQPCEGYGVLESPILQSAFSLPLLHEQGELTPEKDNKGKKTKKTMNNNHIANGKAISHETGLNNMVQTPNRIPNGPEKPRRIPDADNHIANGHYNVKPATVNEPAKLPMSDTTSLDEGWELDLDLGTSLMDDVMGIMDKIEL